MTIEHSLIAEAYLHEPKGVSTATAGKAYLSNGSGSGTWTKVQPSVAACLRASSTGATTGVTTAYQAINNATLGGTISWAQNVAEGMTTDTTSGYIVVPATGIYSLTYVISLVPSTASSTFRFTIGVDSGGGIVSKEATILSEIRTSSTADTYQATISCLPSLTANDKVYAMVLESAAGRELTIVSSNLTMTRIT